MTDSALACRLLGRRAPRRCVRLPLNGRRPAKRGHLTPPRRCVRFPRDGCLTCRRTLRSRTRRRTTTSGGRIMSKRTFSARHRSPSGARRVPRLLAAPVAVIFLALLAVPAFTGTAAALNKSTPGVAATPSAIEPHWLCPEGPCEAIAAPRPVKVGTGFAALGSSHLYEGSGELGGYDPADLKSAYDIPSGTEGTQTVAVVDAFGYPNAEADLAAYRSRYGLPACTTANGCFKKVNE